MEIKTRIRSFEDLDVYRSAYDSMLIVHKDILPHVPSVENYDLKDQLRRASKAIPRLIAEGHSKRHQRRGFQKYIDDAMEESNEMIVSLHQVCDLYGTYVNTRTCKNLIDAYDKVSRQ
jgi:four helix bundle protein